MNSSGKEKNKLILIAVLSVVFVLVAYVRFFPRAGIHGTGSSAAPAGTIPAVAAPPGLETGPGRETPGADSPGPRTVTRDIFAPGRGVYAAGESKTPLPGGGAALPPPAFKLSGVIAGKGSAIAIINGKFLKQGDSIEEYRIVGIADGKVVLSGSNGQKIILNLLKTMDKQF